MSRRTMAVALPAKRRRIIRLGLDSAMPTSSLAQPHGRPQPAPMPSANGAPARVSGQASIHLGLAEDRYAHWPAPVCIIADGPYGVDGFPGDARSPAALAQWYAPHIAAWSSAATPQTTLWFWNTEAGWATVHGALLAHGWAYRCCNIWDKGLGHIAGNANARTLMRAKFHCEIGVTNVWREPQVGGAERVQGERSGMKYKFRSLHGS